MKVEPGSKPTDNASELNRSVFNTLSTIPAGLTPVVGSQWSRYCLQNTEGQPEELYFAVPCLLLGGAPAYHINLLQGLLGYNSPIKFPKNTKLRIVISPNEDAVDSTLTVSVPLPLQLAAGEEKEVRKKAEAAKKAVAAKKTEEAKKAAEVRKAAREKRAAEVLRIKKAAAAAEAEEARKTEAAKKAEEAVEAAITVVTTRTEESLDINDSELTNPAKRVKHNEISGNLTPFSVWADREERIKKAFEDDPFGETESRLSEYKFRQQQREYYEEVTRSPEPSTGSFIPIYSKAAAVQSALSVRSVEDGQSEASLTKPVGTAEEAQEFDEEKGRNRSEPGGSSHK